MSVIGKRRQKLLDANCYFLNWSEARGLGLVALDHVLEERSGVLVRRLESHWGGDNQRIQPKVTGIYPKGCRRMQASELLDLKDLQSKKQKYGVRKVQCLNRCNLLIKRSACRLSSYQSQK